MNILEARQQDSNTISKANGDYETILQGDCIVLEQGDTLEMSEAFIDTTETAAQSVFIAEDTEIKISYVMYKVLSDTTVPIDNINLWQNAANPNGAGFASGMPFKYYGVNRDAPPTYQAFFKQPLSSPDAPAIMGQYLVGRPTGIGLNPDLQVRGIQFRYLDHKRPIPAFTMLIEITDMRNVVSSIPIHIPAQPALGTTVPKVEELLFKNLRMGNGFRVRGVSTFGAVGTTPKILNPKTLIKNNFQLVECLTETINEGEKHFVPVRRRFVFTLPAGKYAPDDIAQIITRETQQIRNSMTSQAYTNGYTVAPLDEKYVLNPRIYQSGQNFNPDNNPNPTVGPTEFQSEQPQTTALLEAGSFLGPHFYTNSLFYPPINYKAANPAIPTAAELVGLTNRYGFYWDVEEFREARATASITPYQLMLTQSAVESVAPSAVARVSAPPSRYATQVYFGSSQGVVMTFNASTNRFQIDNLHSPYYLQASTSLGKIGWKYCDVIVPVEITETTARYSRGAPPSADMGIQGSLGGVMLTGLEPFDFWETTLGFDVNDVCMPISYKENATEWIGGNTYNNGLPPPDKIEITSTSLDLQGLSPLLTNATDALSTAPKMFFAVNDNIDNSKPYPISGVASLRNVYYGRKMTSAFLDKSSTIQFDIEGSSTSQLPDANYEFNIPPGSGGWYGNWNGPAGHANNEGRDYLMRMGPNGGSPAVFNFLPPDESEQTATTFIRAKNFAQGTTLSSAYYLVEIAGLFQNTFVGGTSYSKMICGILNRYYSTGQFTSGSTPFSYTHLGAEPLHLKSLRIRILTPDGKLATGIGSDNSVILTHRKSAKTLMLDNLNILDANSSKKDIADRQKLLQEINK